LAPVIMLRHSGPPQDATLRWYSGFRG